MGVSAARKPVFFLLSTDAESARRLLRAITLSTSVNDAMECFWFDSLHQCNTALADGKTTTPTIILVDLGTNPEDTKVMLDGLTPHAARQNIPLIALVHDIAAVDHKQIKDAGAEFIIPRSTRDTAFDTAFLALSETITARNANSERGQNPANQNKGQAKVA